MLKRLLFAVLLALTFAAHAAVNSLPWGPKPQFVDANGAPMSGGTLQTLVAGSSTPQVTYTDSTGGVGNPTTITLNTRGETPNEVWLTAGQSYKLILKDAAGATVWTVDNIVGVNDVIGAFDEWKTGPTPTFVSASSFTLVGDQTATFTVGRRVKTTNSGGTMYGRITASAFAAATTVTLQMDGAQVLDSGLSAVSYGLLSSTIKSGPERIATAAGTDTYTATVGISRLVIGDEYKIKIANTNTSTTPTLNLDSLGAKTIVRLDSSALVAGDLNGEHLFRWNGTNMVALNIVGAPFVDTSALVKGSGDATKKARFEVDGLTTGTTRVYTLQDSDDTLVGRATTDTLTNKSIDIATNTLNLHQLTSSLAGDVAMNNTAIYFNGPSVAQGTSGTWLFTATVTLKDTAGAAAFNVRITDGTTIIASARAQSTGASIPITVSVSGILTNPVGTVFLRVQDPTSVNGVMIFNATGDAKDTTITAVRIG